MSIKKALLLASMALAAVAFAAPATASAEENFWLHEGNTEEAAQTVVAEGEAKFNTLGTGIACDSRATITANESGHSSTGIVHFTVILPTCEGFGETFEGCKVEEIKETGEDDYLSFIYHLTNGKIVVTNAAIDSVLDEGCSDSTVKITFPTVTATPDNSGSISSATLSSEGGKAFVNGSPFGFPNVAEGTLAVQGGDAGTYGIG